MSEINEALLVPARHPGRTAEYMRDHEILALGPVVYRDSEGVLHRGVAIRMPTEPTGDCALVYAPDAIRALLVVRSGLYLDMMHRPSLDHVLYRATLKRLQDMDMGGIGEHDTLESASMVVQFSVSRVWVTANLSLWHMAGFRSGVEIKFGIWEAAVPCDTPYAVLPGGGSLVQALGVVKFAKEVFSS